MGIQTVAIHSTADANAMCADGRTRASASAAGGAELSERAEHHRRLRDHGAEAIHPGYGFLEREREFRADRRGSWPDLHRSPSEHIRLMGDKITAKETMKAGRALRAGLGWRRPDAGGLKKVAAQIGYPVIVKATAGGGGGA